ncbi:MAG: hypothetical protein UX06_C0046G0002 [Candidatus Giovannonibacteria bacterium GW2011_GWA2_45_21]|uniref:Methyltransferase domain-containing protein n=1 Tax=Candidatus Giovannonibacteria bacterium GW2011_GWA2_45_21 TaxID=1618649 RepID=A0A0G1M419_9BACT|nr:MAG: hypothetical protein UX06_C0046G0002 [Candidatus Giovannonibacteria bacterium GW2011_GWA2_45_21]
MPFSFFKKKVSVSNSLRSASDYLIIQICLGLEQIGFFDYLKKGPATITNISRDLHVQQNFIAVLLDYLLAIDGPIKKNGDTFALKGGNPQKLLWAILAYREIFNNFGDLLFGEKKYGQDIHRDGYYLQLASGAFSFDANRIVLEKIKEVENSVLIDFGCGSAETLIKFCSMRGDHFGVGIDNNETVISEARKRIQRSGMGERTVLCHADVRNIDFWQKHVSSQKKPIFLASTMLHEFLRFGDAFLIDFLKELKERFNSSRLFVAEYDGLSFEEIRNEKDERRKLQAALYELWHPFTEQGMPQPRERWESLLDAAGWKISEVVSSENYILVCDCS